MDGFDRKERGEVRREDAALQEEPSRPPVVEVSAVDSQAQEVEVVLKGSNSMGSHVSGTARVRLP